MKKFLLGTVAIFALGTVSAVAADLPARTYTKAPAYVAPVYNWTGFYIGAHVGGAFNGSDSFLATPGIVGAQKDGSFIGGGQIGADYQFSPNWLLGIEGQISGMTDSNRTFTDTVGVGTLRDRSDWLASVTGRLGYTWGPGLIYVKGGAAFRDNGLTGTGTFVGGVTNRDDTGYTVGGGLEYMFAPAWSAKIEYQYYNFGTTDVVAPAGVISYKDDLHTVKAGINYHFNWGGRVVAKY